LRRNGAAGIKGRLRSGPLLAFEEKKPWSTLQEFSLNPGGEAHELR
jgi:hypothetical protein